MRSKNGPATMPDVTVDTPLDRYPEVVTAREGLQAAIEHQERLSFEWERVLVLLDPDNSDPNIEMLSLEEKHAAKRRKALLPDEFELAAERVALARTRHEQARARAKQELLDARWPRLVELLRDACRPIEEAAGLVDALAAWLKETCELGQLSQLDMARWQHPLSHFILMHGTPQWRETKQLFIDQGLL